MRRIVSAILAIGLGIAAIALVLLGMRMWTALKEVNEPNPATYPPERLARVARAAGIDAQIDRVLYVNQDVNAGIFIGRNLRLDSSMIADGQYRPNSGRSGTVHVRRLEKGRVFVAYCAATTRGEWSQAKEWFSAKEAAALRNLPVLPPSQR